jgi:hypothetical protein
VFGFKWVFHGRNEISKGLFFALISRSKRVLLYPAWGRPATFTSISLLDPELTIFSALAAKSPNCSSQHSLRAPV